MPEFSLKDVAQHKDKDDLWLVVHGKVLDATKYLHEHPGGIEIILETAGTDASEAFDDAGHSQDAFDIMEPYVIGNLRGAKMPDSNSKAPAVVPVKSADTRSSTKVSKGRILAVTIGLGSILGAVRVLAKALHVVNLDNVIRSPDTLMHLEKLANPKNLGFIGGFLTATTTFTAVSALSFRKLARLADVGGGFTKYPRAIKSGKPLGQDLVAVRGFLEPKTYQYLTLIEKTEMAHDVYRLSFELPTPKTVLGLPVGQHVAIKADVGGQSVSRSYTPISNNTDLGRLDLLIRCYPDGLLTGQYLQKLNLGDEVAFRGPKGAMRYKRGLAKKIGMIAGGTGITPMYQLIRAICEDDQDTTEVSLVYANRSESDILLRQELDSYARRYPRNFKIWYMLDKPLEGWTYGAGYVDANVIRKHLATPTAETKVLLCGPPGMVNACKKALDSLGFELGGAVPKMADQVFTF